MAALINWLLAEGQTSHLEELTGPALPGCVSANDNKDARRAAQEPGVQNSSRSYFLSGTVGDS